MALNALIDWDSSSTSISLSPHLASNFGFAAAACADGFLDADRADANAATPANTAMMAATPHASRPIHER
jgi:hypothetical protein